AAGMAYRTTPGSLGNCWARRNSASSGSEVAQPRPRARRLKGKRRQGRTNRADRGHGRGWGLIGRSLACRPPRVQRRLESADPHPACGKDGRGASDGEVRAVPMHAPVAHAVAVAPIERAIVRQINVVRRADHLAPVRLSPDLSKVARGHNRDMLSHQLMTHDAGDGTSFAARMTRRLAERYRLVGETIYWGALKWNPTPDAI